MASLIPRRLEPLLESGLESARIVALVGARQVGKTSLVERFATESRTLVTLDDIGTLTQARADPVGFIAGLGSSAIVDEVQRAPDLVLAIKAAVDRKNMKGQFLLTGSANLFALPNLSESLAGRMSIFELSPFAQAELAGVNSNFVDHLFEAGRPWRVALPTGDDIVHRIVRGGYPEAVFSHDDVSRNRWFASYLLAMVQRDIREITNVSDASSIGRLLAVLGARTGRVANYTSLASEAGLAKTTLIRYVSLLESTFLLYRMPAWSLDLGRRLTKLPKIFLADTGVAAHLMNVDVTRINADRNLLGGLLETFVANELRKHASWSDRRVTIYHYRESQGLEVDFILEAAGGARVAVEVKATRSPSREDARGILRLMDDPKLRLTRGIVIHTGTDIIPIRANVHGVPVGAFWS